MDYRYFEVFRKTENILVFSLNRDFIIACFFDQLVNMFCYFGDFTFKEWEKPSFPLVKLIPIDS